MESLTRLVSCRLHLLFKRPHARSRFQEYDRNEIIFVNILLYRTPFCDNTITYAGIQKVLTKQFSFFLFYEGREDSVALKAGHHQPASETPFKWPLDCPTLNAGLVALTFLGDPD